MRLPNAERAVVEREKIADYLLNPAHPDNGGKAAFFLALGCKRDDWPSLAAALRRLAVATEQENPKVHLGKLFSLQPRINTDIHGLSGEQRGGQVAANLGIINPCQSVFIRG